MPAEKLHIVSMERSTHDVLSITCQSENNCGKMLKFAIQWPEAAILKQNMQTLSFIGERKWANHIPLSLNKGKTYHSLASDKCKEHQFFVAIIDVTNIRTSNKENDCRQMDSLNDEIHVDIKPDSSYEVCVFLLDIYKHKSDSINVLSTGAEQPTDFLADVVLFEAVNRPCTHVKPDIPIFTKCELRQLERQCKAFVNGRSVHKMVNIKHFYRNKPPTYFEDITDNHDGNMEPYIKDMSGDPRCPINGRLDGLFFMAFSQGQTSAKLPQFSHFGSKRLLVQVEKMFNSSHRLYFSDFFCMNSKNHYVTLVITKPASDSDLYCQRHLLPLDLQDNPYLKINPVSGLTFVCKKKRLFVEVMYTETINIEAVEGIFQDVRGTLGRGESSKMGIRKNKDCEICNLKTD